MESDATLRRPSYERVNYGLRPAKAIERRLLCEAFQRLYSFQAVHQYGYIGFGSIYFTDFQIAHRILGISDLTSIERDIPNGDRFTFNLPFGCIDLRLGESAAVLPTLDWSRRRIVWLDYDGRLDLDVLADIATVVGKGVSGTMLVVSVNAHAEPEPSESECRAIERRAGQAFSLPVYRLGEFNRRLEGKVPGGVTGKDLTQAKVGEVTRQVVLNEVREQLSTRNKLAPSQEKMEFRQILNLRYRDGARMLTLGGVLVGAAEISNFEACHFEGLPFVRTGDDPFIINAPCLTLREMRYLNARLPTDDHTLIERGGIPEEDVRWYAELYRYFPSFNEVVFD